MLKLKLQYFGHLMRRVDSLEKTLMLGGIEGRRRRGRQRMRWLDGITTRWTWVWVNSGSWWWTGRPSVLQIHGVTKSRTWLSDWTELKIWYRYGRIKEYMQHPPHMHKHIHPQSNYFCQLSRLFRWQLSSKDRASQTLFFKNSLWHHLA